MFENLTDRLSNALRNLTGKAKLTEDNIKTTLSEIKNALLEADVALEVVTDFVENVKSQAIGESVSKDLLPGQFLVKIVKEELTRLMGSENSELSLKAVPPVVILIAGLQGSGKTTTVAKLAKHLQEKQKKSVMVTSCDIYRPAAIKQLETVSEQVGASFFPSTSKQKPLDIATQALTAAKNKHKDVLIVDTAGRLHIDNQMMDEVSQLHAALNPTETLFVVDSMTGQDAALSAKAFHAALPLTGIILTKIDGDSRGGAALSVKYLTGKPIVFLGVGEKLDALEPFHPDRIASRILGMGDALSLIEEIESKIDKKKSQKLAKKVSKGRGMDLEDFKNQLQEMSKMGGLKSIMDKLPGIGAMAKGLKEKVNDKNLLQMIVIINSMTMKERKHPALIKGSRKQRIAKGSGHNIQDVSRLLRQHQQMQKMFKKVSGKNNLKKMMRGLEGRLPPGGLPGNLEI